MGGGLSVNNPTIVNAFHSALLRQGLIALVLVAVLAITWNILRGMQIARVTGQQGASGTTDGPASTVAVDREPAARQLLRISFGLLWVFDGFLQGQASMPAGMISGAVQPSATASPSWVQHVVTAGTNVWSYHPVTAAAAAVWIQVGIGLWLLVAPRGNWSRLAGVGSAAWGIVVWVFGEAFGSIFAPGLSWMFGAPGAVLFYVVAGVLVALPVEVWSTPRTGRIILRATGAFFVGMAVLQAWPGRGFWQGQRLKAGPAGTLTAMLQQMGQTPQPHPLASMVNTFAGFDSAHGWAVNLFVVVVLAGIGASFIVARPKVTRYGIWAAVVVCLADWVLVEDLGFMGGVGTDPNSMIPTLLIILAGYVALTRIPEAAGAGVEPAVVATGSPAPVGSRPWREVVALDPAYALRAVGAMAAFGIVLIGALPMALAATRSNADTILNTAINGPVAYTNFAAPAFQLVDQNGAKVSLASLHGKAVALTFLDPVCTSDCPVIAREFADTDPLLGSDASRVVLIAIDANPIYRAGAFLTAFDRQERLQTLPNWLFLTGSLTALEQAWRSYGVEVDMGSGGAMVLHSDLAYVIDPAGRTFAEVNADPGPGTSASSSSFSVTLAGALKKALGGS
jgi:cytochrome oxidase Cu insertion factor (SCO1/SenC/PrrC family)